VGHAVILGRAAPIGINVNDSSGSADEGHCRIAFVADAQIHLERTAGIPALVARRFQEPVERFVVEQLRPNFNAITAAGDGFAAAVPNARWPLFAQRVVRDWP